MTSSVKRCMHVDDEHGDGGDEPHGGGDGDNHNDDHNDDDVTPEAGHDHSKDHDPDEGTNCSQVHNIDY